MGFSLHRKPNSPYWFAYIRVRDAVTGEWRQTTKSTRETTKAKAEAKARELEKAAADAAGAGDEKSRAIYEVLKRAADAAVRGELNEGAARVALSDLLTISTGRGLAVFTVREWLMQWLRDKAKGNAAGTYVRYKGVVDQFVAFLPANRADGNLLALTPGDIRDFRDAELAAGKSASTVNNAIKILRIALTQARRQQVLLSNPAEAVGLIAEDELEKAVFSPEDVRRLLDAAEGDWRGAILFGYFTGASIGDIAALRWGQIDLAGGRLTYSRKKTSRKVTLPLHAELADLLLALPAPDDPKAFVFPTLAGRRTGGHHGLSLEFAGIMEKAGIRGDAIEAAPAENGGRSKGRTRRTLTFHSLRHSFNSALANAGVPVEIRQQFTGHSSAEMNQHYTHHELETFRRAIDTLPGIRKEGGR